MRNKNAKVSDPNSFITCAGDRYHIIYSPVVNNDGTIELKATGRDDIQEMIDSYRDQTDMAFIIKRLEMGDTSVLTDKKPMYGDFTSVPSSQAEMLQTMIDARAAFDQLPLDIKNNFNNDFNQWFAQSGNDDWFEKMKIETEESNIEENNKEDSKEN